jgi:hypothetical protein
MRRRESIAKDDAPRFPYYGLLLAATHALEGRVSQARSVLTSIVSQGFRANRAYLQDMEELTSSATLTELLIPIWDE